MSREIILILGKTGHGKSVWLRTYARGIKRLFGYDPLREFPLDHWSNTEELIDLYDGGAFQANKSFRIGSNNEADLDILGYLAFLSGQCTLALEEASLIFTRGQRLTGWIRDIVFLGRHRDVSLIVTAQRAASIPIELRSQASRLITFAQSEDDDVQWLKSFIRKENLSELPYLPELECFDSHRGEVRRYKISVD